MISTVQKSKSLSIIKKKLLAKRYANILKAAFEKSLFFANVALRSVVSGILQESISAHPIMRNSCVVYSNYKYKLQISLLLGNLHLADEATTNFQYGLSCKKRK